MRSHGETAARRARSQPRDQTFVRQHAADVPALGERAAQFVGVPAGACAENDDVHQASMRSRAAESCIAARPRYRRHQSKSDARSTSASSRPAWNVRPLVALVSHTSAGLNSIGSIL